MTTHSGRYLDPWIPVKQCSRRDGIAIQAFLASPGQSGTQAKPLASPRASNMRSKAIPRSQNRPQKACPRPSNGRQMVAVSNPSKHRIVVSSNPEFKGRRQGAKPFIYIYIYSSFCMGGGVWGVLSFSVQGVGRNVHVVGAQQGDAWFRSVF